MKEKFVYRKDRLAGYWRMLCLLLPLLVFCSCEYDKAQIPVTGNFPPPVASIMLTKCAVSGCHNAASSVASNGLSLTSYANLFKGGDNGAVVIAYRPDQSSLTFFTDVYDDYGTSLSPQMPLNGPYLSHAEIKTLHDWILSGAPDANGNLFFTEGVPKRKIYLTNQGCDLVYVIDPTSRLPMRAITVGVLPGVSEGPHQVRISPDGQYWYVVFYQGQVLQKFSTLSDQLIASYPIGQGNWSTVALSRDNTTAYVTDWSSNGKIAIVDLVGNNYNYYPGLYSPHGSMLSHDQKTLYLTAQTGNFIYKIDLTIPLDPRVSQVSLNGRPPETVSSLDPHEILFSADSSHYFVTCQTSSEVRVLQTSNDSVIGIIKTGYFPQEMALSNTGLLYVTCTNDSTNVPPHTRGSVAVVNTQTLSLQQIIYGFYQPHGICADDINHVVYVANENASPSGPAPHHVSDCGGRDGYMLMINQQTFSLIGNYRPELSTDPYSMVISN